jgi:benzoyl-CoA reductase/2-hydroxyglutaryl-CoA dehydratase subunit BcrC/BadD/HgdB
MIQRFREAFENRHELSRQLKKDGKKIVGCFYGGVPKELIHAAGMVPVQLVEDKDYRYEEKSLLLPYLCGMSKNLTGQLYEKVFDYVDAAMVSTVCDTNRRVTDIWAYNDVVPKIWIIRAPAMSHDTAVDYFANELRRLGGELGELSGIEVTEERLRSAVKLFNENRRLFREFYEARFKTPVSAEDAVYVFASALVMPVEEHNAMMRELLDSLPAEDDGNDATPIMLCAVNLNLSVDVIRMAEKLGGRVVTDDLTHNSRYGSYEIDLDGDAFKAVAKGYLRKIPIPGMYSFEDRATYIRDLMQEAGAEGMIYLIQLYCDAYAMEYACLKEYFDRWDLKHLKIEAEDTPTSVEQLNVRIQSFLESLI